MGLSNKLKLKVNARELCRILQLFLTIKLKKIGLSFTFNRTSIYYIDPSKRNLVNYVFPLALQCKLKKKVKVFLQ